MFPYTAAATTILIQEGYFADLVLLDCERLADRATYEDPKQARSGIDSVWINGRLVLAQEEALDLGAGRVLRL